MNVISLFSGAGGLDIGLENAGFDTRLAIEIDADCRATILRNRPHWNPSNVHDGDITKFSAAELLQLSGLRRGEVDLIAGGPPCQSFSNMGKRGGFGDDRGQLVRTYFEMVLAIRPKAFVFENVQGLLQHPDVISYIERQLEGRYAVEMRLINAADFGVPQLRKRVVIIGALGNQKVCFPAPTHAEADSLLGLRPWVTVRDALQSIPIERLKAPDNMHMQHADHMVERMRMIKPGQNFHSLPMRMRPDCWRNGKHQGADTFGRLEWDRPSVTIRTCGYNPTKGRYIHPSKHRGLSTLEMAALQSFPTDYEFVGKIGSVGRQIGNAVPPRLGEAIGHAIARHLRARARRAA